MFKVEGPVVLEGAKEKTETLKLAPPRAERFGRACPPGRSGPGAIAGGRCPAPWPAACGFCYFISLNLASAWVGLTSLPVIKAPGSPSQQLGRRVGRAGGSALQGSDLTQTRAVSGKVSPHGPETPLGERLNSPSEDRTCGAEQVPGAWAGLHRVVP